MDLMRTHDLRNKRGDVYAFEVSSLIGRRMARRIAASAPGARIVKSNLRQDQFCEFEIAGERYIIEEPWGDSSRYWIGRADGMRPASLELVRARFAASKLGTSTTFLKGMLLLALVALSVYQPLSRFMSQDSCLDAGKRWNASQSACDETQNDHPKGYAADKEAVLKQLAICLKELPKSSDSPFVSPCADHDGVSRVTDMSRSDIQLAIGWPTYCEPVKDLLQGEQCKSSLEWLYSFYHLPEDWQGGGPELVIRFDSSDRITAASWVHTQ